MSPELKLLKRLIRETFRGIFLVDSFGHTLGGYFRLLCHRVIKVSLKHLLYIDTDVVIMANLEAVLRQVEKRPDALFHWGLTMCSGFVVMNFQRMEEIWILAQSSNVLEVSRKYNQAANDQLIFMSVNVTYPSEVNILEPGWDMTVTNRWKSTLPLEVEYPNVGMLHFNGGGKSKEAFFGGNDSLTKNEKYRTSWGNAGVYTTLSWAWARYQTRTLVRPGSVGRTLQIRYWGMPRQGNVTA